VAGFYRGLQANVMRACILNGTKMACYDAIKGYVSASTGWSRKDLRCQFSAAVGAGFFMAVSTTPFDMVRTKLMNQPPDQKLYSGFLDACYKIARADGVTAFYRGFFPIWMRFAPHATAQLVLFETLLRTAGYKPL
jgi:hypothetical protein